MAADTSFWPTSVGITPCVARGVGTGDDVVSSGWDSARIGLLRRLLGAGLVWALATALLPAVPAAAGISPAPASRTTAALEPCTQPLVIGARGSGEAKGFGDTVARATNAFNRGYGAPTDAVWLDYEAASTRLLWRNPPAYFDSVEDGIDALLRLLRTRAARCPRQPVVLFGYSQGAMVTNEVLHRLNDVGSPILKRIRAVGLIADPLRVGGAAYNIGSAGEAHDGMAARLPRVKDRKLPRSIRGRSRSLCVDGDVICAFTRRDLREHRFRRHGVYVDGPAGKLGRWAAGRLRPQPGDVAVQFVKAVMEDGDAQRFVRDVNVVGYATNLLRHDPPYLNYRYRVRSCEPVGDITIACSLLIEWSDPSVISATSMVIDVFLWETIGGDYDPETGQLEGAQGVPPYVVGVEVTAG